MSKTILALIILGASILVSFGQKVPNIELLNQFENFGSDYLRSTLDTLLTETIKNTKSKGYIVIYGTKNNLSLKFALEQRVKSHFKLRNYNKELDSTINRIFIIRGADRENAQMELWFSDNGSEPNVNKSDWNYKLPFNQESFLFGRGNVTVRDNRIVQLGEDAVDWEPTSDLRMFAEYLRANQNFEGHLIIYNDSKRKAKSTIKFLTKILVNEFKVSPNRIRSVYGGKLTAERWFELELRLVSVNK